MLFNEYEASDWNTNTLANKALTLPSAERLDKKILQTIILGKLKNMLVHPSKSNRFRGKLNHRTRKTYGSLINIGQKNVATRKQQERINSDPTNIKAMVFFESLSEPKKTELIQASLHQRVNGYREYSIRKNNKSSPIYQRLKGKLEQFYTDIATPISDKYKEFSVKSYPGGAGPFNAKILEELQTNGCPIDKYQENYTQRLANGRNSLGKPIYIKYMDQDNTINEQNASLFACRQAELSCEVGLYIDDLTKSLLDYVIPKYQRKGVVSTRPVPVVNLLGPAPFDPSELDGIFNNPAAGAPAPAAPISAAEIAIERNDPFKNLVGNIELQELNYGGYNIEPETLMRLSKNQKRELNTILKATVPAEQNAAVNNFLQRILRGGRKTRRGNRK